MELRKGLDVNASSSLRAKAPAFRLSNVNVPARAAATDCALLLTGETGTGKGHMAQWIHRHSARAAGPFVPVNCGAIPESIADSHLFGHARGSFSGASTDHIGLVRAADGGTLLLDEVGELPAHAQLRLLRLLEEREVQPVGVSLPIKVNVRIIAATNGDLRAAVQRGTFRQDLFFRLDVVSIHLQPLRERRAEIMPLLAQFNDEFADLYRQAALVLDDCAIEALMSYDWPGNVRELRTLVERLHVLCGGAHPITADHLRECGQLRMPHTGIGAALGPARLTQARLDAIQQVLAVCRGNISRAAETLGVHRSTLYRWLAEHPRTARERVG
jgi:transcriptional regulator with PAS, ATPase and Fis domain